MFFSFLFFVFRNNHPSPLVLTIAEMDNPLQVIHGFFDCYRLPDIRQCLQDWLHDGLCPDTVECKQHVDTCQRLEKLVEAAWCIQQKGEGVQQRDAMTATEEEDEEPEMEEQPPLLQPQPDPRFTKPGRTIDKVQQQPLWVIQQVFDSISLEHLRDELLPDLMQAALANNCGAYTGKQQKKLLTEFYDQLLLLTEALYFIRQQQQPKPTNKKGQKPQVDNIRPEYLDAVQMASPVNVVFSFCSRFSRSYTRGELWDMLDAAANTTSNLTSEFNGQMAVMAYEHLQCLTKAAYVLYQKVRK